MSKKILEERLPRKILLNGDINKEATESVWTQLEALREEGVTDDAVFLYINSGGGSVIEGMFLCDYIKSIKEPEIQTIVMGEAQSAAFNILQTGSCRMCYQNSTLMIHDSRLPGFETGVNAMSSYVHQIERMEETFYKMISERSRMSIHDIKKKVKNRGEWYITPEKAVKYGFIDEIIY